VLQKQVITPVPNTPEYFSGVINFRGEIIPVLDTRTKLGLPVTQFDEQFVIIVIEIETDTEKIVAGAIVDRVKDVIVIEKEQIMPVPKMNKQIKSELFSGIVRVEGAFIIIINFDKLILTNEAVLLSEFTQASTQMLDDVDKEELTKVDDKK
jgi:purine-binding chemotaxis protein CheW